MILPVYSLVSSPLITEMFYDYLLAYGSGGAEVTLL
jgi:hypothetical protein